MSRRFCSRAVTLPSSGGPLVLFGWMDCDFFVAGRPSSEKSLLGVVLFSFGFFVFWMQQRHMAPLSVATPVKTSKCREMRLHSIAAQSTLLCCPGMKAIGAKNAPRWVGRALRGTEAGHTC